MGVPASHVCAHTAEARVWERASLASGESKAWTRHLNE